MEKKIFKRIIDQIINSCNITALLIENSYFNDNLKKLEGNLDKIGGAWSGSYIGYHANVYYRNFATPAPGDHFSVEWGFGNFMGQRSSSENWQEVSDVDVEAEAFKDLDGEFKEQLDAIAEKAKGVLIKQKQKLINTINVHMKSSKSDSLKGHLEHATGLVVDFIESRIIDLLQTKQRLMTYDETAVSQGLRYPPHLKILAWKLSKEGPFQSLRELSTLSESVWEFIEMFEAIESSTEIENKIKGERASAIHRGAEAEAIVEISKKPKVFIGHGGSAVWKDLKEFITERLGLKCVEFNLDSAAGKATPERLNEMLSESDFAFLIMTGEDKHEDEKKHARENVIHEMGLFQGRLGFEKAIILKEEGCEEFSNIHGLTHIPFPNGNIGAASEQIREVLEREGILKQLS